jgi:SAM-dependent methyltransferase
MHREEVVRLHALRSAVGRWLPRRVKVALKHAFWLGPGHFCPICRSHLRTFRPAGRPVRPEARCPICNSLERHRLLWNFFRQRSDLFDGNAKRILHFAPEELISRRIRKLPGVDYVPADLMPGDGIVQMDVTDIRYPDGSFDVVLCSHVLEHVEDDRLAMRELLRVLAPDGWAVLLVPVFPEPTFEDASASDPTERERLFGQHDHLRKYGPDFEDRLREAGWQVQRFDAPELLGAREQRRLGVPDDESVFLCSKVDRAA